MTIDRQSDIADRKQAKLNALEDKLEAEGYKRIKDPDGTEYQYKWVKAGEQSYIVNYRYGASGYAEYWKEKIRGSARTKEARTDLGTLLLDRLKAIAANELLSLLVAAGGEYKIDGECNARIMPLKHLPRARQKALSSVRAVIGAHQLATVKTGNTNRSLVLPTSDLMPNCAIVISPSSKRGVTIEVISRTSHDQLIIEHNRAVERMMEREQLRKTGLAKLTFAEKQALGLC